MEVIESGFADATYARVTNKCSELSNRVIGRVMNVAWMDAYAGMDCGIFRKKKIRGKISE